MRLKILHPLLTVLMALVAFALTQSGLVLAAEISDKACVSVLEQNIDCDESSENESGDAPDVATHIWSVTDSRLCSLQSARFDAESVPCYLHAQQPPVRAPPATA